VRAPTVVRVVVPTGAADVATDLLWQFCPQAVSESEEGTVVVLIAGFDDADMAAAAHRAASARFSADLQIADLDSWVEIWRSGEPRHQVGPFCLRLPEHAPDATQIDLVIEPGTTFGYSHASTRLALALLSAIELAGRRVADIGCGSGVLAIAAAHLGATPVHAVDIDERAVELAELNAIANGVVVSAMPGSVAALPCPHYDVIVANLLAPTLCDLAPAIADRATDSTIIVVSGLLQADEARVCQAFAPRVVQARQAEHDWLALVFA
jgi:ribosomal protein L11 methyltransferase